MLKQIFSILTIGFFAFAIFSCDGRNVDGTDDATLLGLQSDLAKIQSDGDFGGHRMGFLGEILDLSDDQKEQIRSIMSEQKEQFRENFHHDRKSGDRPSREERQAFRQERHAEMINAIMPVLNEEQQSIVKEIQAARERGEVPQILIDKRVEKLAEALTLSQDQQVQIAAIFKETGEQMIALKDNDGSRRDRREAMKALHDSADSKVQVILNADQTAAYEALKEARKERRRHHRGKFARKFSEKRVEHRLERLTAELELTEDQQVQVKDILESARESIMQEFESGQSGDRESRREAMRGHFEEVDNQIQAILTESQLEKYEAHKEEHHGKRKGGGFWRH